MLPQNTTGPGNVLVDPGKPCRGGPGVVSSPLGDRQDGLQSVFYHRHFFGSMRFLCGCYSSAYSTGQMKNTKKFTLVNFLSFKFCKSELSIFLAYAHSQEQYSSQQSQYDRIPTNKRIKQKESIKVTESKYFLQKMSLYHSTMTFSLSMSCKCCHVKTLKRGQT